MRWFRRSLNGGWSAPTAEELELYDALLAGGTPSLTALRGQLETPLCRGISRTPYPQWLDLSTVYIAEWANLRHVLPSRASLRIDDLTVTFAELAEPVPVLGYVSEGILTTLRLSPPPPEGWPKRMTLREVAYTQPDGTVGDQRSSEVLRAYEDALAAAPACDETPPRWLRPLGAAALRPHPRPPGQLGHQDVIELGRWIQPTTLGGITLLGGDEYHELEGHSVVIAEGIDGSAYVARDRRVLHHSLDGQVTAVAPDVRRWVRDLASSDE